jgi:hypothetical protein
MSITEEQATALLANMEKMQATIDELKKGTATPPLPEPPKPATPKAAPSVDELIAQKNAAEQKAGVNKALINATATAQIFLNNIEKEGFNEVTKGIVDAYNGNPDDLIRKQAWTMDAYIKAQGMKNITPEVLASYGDAYKIPITAAQNAITHKAKYDVVKVYKLIKEIEVMEQRKKEEADRLKSLQVVKGLAPEELAKLSPQKQAEYNAQNAHQAKVDERWGKNKGEVK